ncbi:MAG TPA: FG-GAP-like repeat-containing protein, partial [bacterium]|nr:FG-GAP-like repeat-containing protein [bacterium]
MWLLSFPATAQSWHWARQANPVVGNSKQITAAATDQHGNVYVTGSFRGPLQLGAVTLSASTTYLQMFVAKIDSSGQWRWARQVTGGTTSTGLGITTDPAGNVIVTGRFAGQPTFGTTPLTNSSGILYEGFVTRLSPSGQWLWTVSSPGRWQGTCLAADSRGIYVGGHYDDSPVFGPSTLGNGLGDSDGFVARLSPSGQWLWGQQIGGPFGESVSGLAIDSSGHAFLSGTTDNGTTTFGPLQVTRPLPGTGDAFAARLDPAGQWRWARVWGGPNYDVGNAIALDASGDAYVTGKFGDQMTFDQVSLATSYPNASTLFIAKLAGLTGQCQWARAPTGAHLAQGTTVCVNPGGQVFVGGRNEGGTAIFGTDTVVTDDIDIFILELSSQGEWQSVLATHNTNPDHNGDIRLNGLAIAPSGYLHAAGSLFVMPQLGFGADTLSSSVPSGANLFVTSIRPGIPRLSGTFPRPHATSVPRTTNPTLRFSAPPLPDSAATARFSVYGSLTGRRAGTTGQSPFLRSFNPTTDFLPGEHVSVSITATLPNQPAQPLVYSFSTASAGPGTFTGAAEAASGTTPRRVVAADFNADGHVDIASIGHGQTGAGSHPLVLALNDGVGNFPDTTRLPLPATGNRLLACADLNADGRPDLLVSLPDSLIGSVRALLNTGSATFTPSLPVPVGPRPTALITGDVDGDGDLDFLTANGADSTLSLRLNDGAGTFSPAPDITPGTPADDAHLADLDGDYDLDLIIHSYAMGRLSCLSNTGTGTFTPAGTLTVSPGPYPLTIADFDADGDVDILSGPGSIFLWPNTGSGTFAASTR